MKVLIAVNSLKWLLTVREELVISLLESGNDIDIVGMFDGGEAELKEKGCHCFNVNVQRRSMNIVSEIKLFLNFRRLIKQLNPDLMLTFSIKANIYASFSARMLGIKRISTITGLGTGLQGRGVLSKLISFLYRISLDKSEVVFFQNTANMQFMKERRIISKFQRVRLVSGSGVNLQKHSLKEYPDTKGGIHFLFIGRLMKEKGVGELLEAFREVKLYNPMTQLILIDFFEEDYRKRLEHINSLPGVIYHSEVADVRPYITQCHCVILPSYHEGMANVLLEAAATGRPVIASNIPGCKETFDEGISGFSCKPRDVQSLILAMSAFLQLDDFQKANMGLAGRRKVESGFNRRKVIEAYLQEVKIIKGKQQVL